MDFIQHRLRAEDAGFYQHHGFTAHQAHSIEHGRGRKTLFTEGALGALKILELAAPRYYVTLVLSVADGDYEASDLIRRYEGVLMSRPHYDDNDQPDTIDSLEKLVAKMGADESVNQCNCTFDIG